MAERHYDIHQLAAMSGCSKLQISRFRKFDLIPPPIGPFPRTAYYTNDHLIRLRELRKQRLEQQARKWMD